MDILNPLPKTSNWSAFFIVVTGVRNLHMPYIYRQPQLDILHWRLSTTTFCLTASLAFFWRTTSHKSKRIRFFNDLCSFSIFPTAEKNGVTPANKRPNGATQQSNSRTLASVREWTLIKLGFIYPAAYIFLYPTNSPIHRNLLFSLLLTREPPSPTLQVFPAPLPHHASQSVPARLLRLHILHWLCLMRAKTDKSLRVAQRWYPQFFDKLVPKIPIICLGDYVYFHWPRTLKPQPSEWQTSTNRKSCRILLVHFE